MNIIIRFATSNELELVRKIDPHSKYVDPIKIKCKINSNEIILAFDNKEPVGLIKFSYFWATRPFLDLIWLKKDYRGKGVGKQLFKFLEEYLINEGYHYLMSSSEKDEIAPQQWHKRQGFIPCGELTSLNLPYENIPEIFFYKKLTDVVPKNQKLKEYPIL